MAKVLEKRENTDPTFDLGGYVTDDASEVILFLEEHPTLVPLLAEAIDPVRQVFGKDTLVSLFLIEDHDSDDGVSLFARIQTIHSVAVARGLRDQFYRDWWNANIHRANDRLIFSLEFIDG